MSEENQDQGLQIVEYRVENFMRLKAFSIKPDGSIITISGENGAGKSATLQGIESTLAGGRAVPDEPIRKGKRKARTILDLGEIVVERQYTKSGSQLVVKGRDGVKVKSPQTVLSQLFNDLSFDPLDFTRMDPQKQDEVLKRLGGLDFTALDAKRSAAYAERTEVNREAKRLAAQLETLERFDDVPAAEVSVAALLKELQDRERAGAVNTKERTRLVELNAGKDTAAERCTAMLSRIAELREQLQAAEEELAEREQTLATQIELVAEQAATVSALTDPDLDEVRAQMATADATNQKVRANAEIAKLETQLEANESKAEQLTETLQHIDEQKQEQIAAAKLPIPGLGFDDVGVTLDGVPFGQASTSQKIRASVAIGAALNPRLRVLLIRNGNDLDQKRLELMAEMASELKLQIWIERIEGGPGGVLIVDGDLADQEPEPAS